MCPFASQPDLQFAVDKTYNFTVDLLRELNYNFEHSCHKSSFDLLKQMAAICDKVTPNGELQP